MGTKVSRCRDREVLAQRKRASFNKSKYDRGGGGGRAELPNYDLRAIKMLRRGQSRAQGCPARMEAGAEYVSLEL
jgi:hypothetical protein